MRSDHPFVSADPARRARRFFVTTGAFAVLHGLAHLIIYEGAPPTPFPWIELATGSATVVVGVDISRRDKRTAGRILTVLWIVWLSQLIFAAQYGLTHPPDGVDVASLRPSPLIRFMLLVGFGVLVSGWLFRSLWRSLPRYPGERSPGPDVGW